MAHNRKGLAMNLEDFRTGDGVAIHPACDCWMQGDKSGTVISVGRKLVKVRLFWSQRVRKFNPQNLEVKRG